ncbi:MAG: GNAT family N-acetyltransferase [Sulfuricurvum sp.]|uniref:GNAT family N-acetyltransferase n=1 Tax=Sulfuricurvum sp. TaxID=2025608 RepID=UPI002638CC3C|nr:GNAT family N-acetyltransferase [Sulfuricurvum sp.]MDD2369869.1 GNAT family N-acetyltransferase [Sulfuricurvum sp.]MDD5117841.1 GNAT family N-acetyltransferase [Sulfuricurvum sp.]
MNTLPLTWKYDSANVDWNELANLYKITPLGDKNPDELSIAFANSMYKCFIYDGEKLVGVGRALADGADVSYICDVAIHPEYQRRGIGKQIVNKLLGFSQGYNKILLFTSAGKEPFYSKFGFDKMTTAMAIFKNRERFLELGLIEE